MILLLVICIILAYLIGSFSTAYWYGKWFFNIDVRQHGSKNAGATNVLRVLGYKAAIPVFIIDVLKAIGATQLVYLIILFFPELGYYSETSYIYQVLFGTAAVIGHVFPVFSGFSGGKGVASLLGIVIAMHPIGAFIALGIFIVVFISFRVVSLGSLVASLSFPIIIYILEGTEITTLITFSIAASCLVVITHIKNIKRLLKGEERKINFNK